MKTEFLEPFVYGWNISLVDSILRNMLETQICQLKLFLLWVFIYQMGKQTLISGEQQKCLVAKKADPKHIFPSNFHAQFHFLKSEFQEHPSHPTLFSMFLATHFVKFNVTTFDFQENQLCTLLNCECAVVIFNLFERVGGCQRKRFIGYPI